MPHAQGFTEGKHPASRAAAHCTTCTLSGNWKPALHQERKVLGLPHCPRRLSAFLTCSIPKWGSAPHQGRGVLGLALGPPRLLPQPLRQRGAPRHELRLGHQAHRLVLERILQRLCLHLSHSTTTKRRAVKLLEHFQHARHCIQCEEDCTERDVSVGD